MPETTPSSEARFCPNCGIPSRGLRYCAGCGFEFTSDFVSPHPPSTADARAPYPAAGVVNPERTIPWGGITIIFGGALAILGSFLPWISATAAFVGTISRNGLDGGGDGIITIVLGFLVVLFGLAIVSRSGRVTAAAVGTVVVSFVLLGVAVLDFRSINDRIASADASVSASIGMGLVVIALGGVLAIVGAIMSVRRRT